MRSAALSLFVALVVVLGIHAAPAASAVSAPRLYLHRGTFDAAAPQPAGVQASAPYAILQFSGPISAADQRALDQTGVRVLEYLPDFAYLVGGTDAQLAAAAALPQAYALAAFTPADKLHPALLRSLDHGAARLGRLRVLGWSGEALSEQALRAAGIDPAVPFDRQALLRAAQRAEVRWIEPLTTPRMLGDTARPIMRVEQAWQSELYGAGQILAIADSGLDTGNLATLSADFAGRIVATHVLSKGGDLEDENGHGTHVAGLAAGAGVLSGANPATRSYAGSFAGVAPETRLVIQAFEADAQGRVVGLDDDYYLLFEQAYNSGARVHSNSWGDATGPLTDTDVENDYGAYPAGSRRSDEFVWQHPDMTIFFAAGNSGGDGTPSGPFGFCQGGDGVIDPDSLLMPGTAKNVITVGASEGQRRSGGLGDSPWLLLTNFCALVAPIVTDTIANNANGMAAFSSRGPTDDGRAKPDLVAPGTNLVAARSHAPGAGTLWGEHNADYVFSGGTSMATPLAAGAGVLARQWLTLNGLPNPSAAAVKATLLNTTASMGVGQYGGGPTQEIPLTHPNSVNGWGRVDLGFTAATGAYRLWVDDYSAGLDSGAIVRYTHSSTRPLEIRSSDQPLRVMLAWSDPPASLSAARQLVNDLDLVVIGPDGTTYPGNAVVGGDRVNNVEGLIIENPPPGRYRVEVRAFNVPVQTQPFALAVAGLLGTDVPAPTVTATTTATATPTTATTPTTPAPSASVLPTAPVDAPGQHLFVPLVGR